MMVAVGEALMAIIFVLMIVGAAVQVYVSYKGEQFRESVRREIREIDDLERAHDVSIGDIQTIQFTRKLELKEKPKRKPSVWDDAVSEDYIEGEK